MWRRLMLSLSTVGAYARQAADVAGAIAGAIAPVMPHVPALALVCSECQWGRECKSCLLLPS